MSRQERRRVGRLDAEEKASHQPRQQIGERQAIDAELATTGEVWTATYAVEVGEPILVSILDLELSGAGRDLESFKAALDAEPALHMWTPP